MELFLTYLIADIFLTLPINKVIEYSDYNPSQGFLTRNFDNIDQYNSKDDIILLGYSNNDTVKENYKDKIKGMVLSISDALNHEYRDEYGDYTVYFLEDAFYDSLNRHYSKMGKFRITINKKLLYTYLANSIFISTHPAQVILLAILISMFFFLLPYYNKENARNVILKDREIKNIPYDECPICLEYYNASDRIVALTCNHTFHKKCISQWLYKMLNCPICKNNFYD